MSYKMFPEFLYKWEKTVLSKLLLNMRRLKIKGYETTFKQSTRNMM